MDAHTMGCDMRAIRGLADGCTCHLPSFKPALPKQGDKEGA